MSTVAPTPSSRPRPGALRVALVGVLLLCLAAGIVLPGSAASDWAYLLVNVGGAAYAWSGDRRRPQHRRGRRPWIPLALTCNAAGSVAWMCLVWTGSTADVSVADAAWAGCYLALIASALTGRFGGRRRRGARLFALLDGCAALAVALLVVFQTSLADILRDGGANVVTASVWIAYPVLDAVVIGLLAWRVVLYGRVRPVAALMVLGLTCWLASDLGWLVLENTTLLGRWLDAGWLLGVALIAVTPWIPHSLTDAPGTRQGSGHGPWRMVLNIAPFAAPALMEALAWHDGLAVDPLPVLLVWLVLLVLTTVRTWLIAQDGQRAWSLVRSQARRSEALAVNSSDAVAVVDAAGRLTADSASLSRSLGVPAAAGDPLADLVARVGGDPETTRVLLARSAARPGVPVELELEGRRPDGSPFWLGGRAVNLVGDPDVAGTVVSLYDVTARTLAERELAHQAFYDGLTGLANRSLFLDLTAQALVRPGRPPIVLCLDLDGFKDVNDSVGHIAGDQLLCAIAERLRGVVRAGDTVARLGGDEFAVLVDDPLDGLADAAVLAQRLLEVITEPVDLDGHRVSVGASIGIVVAEPESTPLSLFRDADIAMYRAKGGGRGRWVVFDPQMRAAELQRIALERELSGALAAGQLRLVHQPVVDLRTEDVVGFEALLRWHHPERGLVMPGEFIPLAEETGLIAPIGEWVLRTACAEAAKWPANVKIAINLSPAQFRNKDLVRIVIGALASSGVSPQRLELEVTETAIMHDSEAVFAALGQLHELGVAIALDDFGTGYSSLSFLQKFSFDKVKIDRSFVSELTSPKEESRTIARAVVRFAVSLGKTTTAEGVETREQWDILSGEACVESQGYYFSPPVRSSEVAQLLGARVKTSANAA